MKQVICLIRPNKYFETKAALLQENFSAMSTYDVYGRGKAPVIYQYQDKTEDTEDYYSEQLVLKKRIDVYLPDDRVTDFIRVIQSVNSTGHSGDGKIFIVPLEDCYRIHTGDRKEDALL